MKCNISKERRELIEKAVGNISDRFVREVYEEDNPQTASGKRFVVPAWTRTLAASVCVVLAVGVFILSIPLVNGIITNRGMGNIPTDPPAAAQTSAFENTDAQTETDALVETEKPEETVPVVVETEQVVGLLDRKWTMPTYLCDCDLFYYQVSASFNDVINSESKFKNFVGHAADAEKVKEGMTFSEVEEIMGCSGGSTNVSRIWALDNGDVLSVSGYGVGCEKEKKEIVKRVIIESNFSLWKYNVAECAVNIVTNSLNEGLDFDQSLIDPHMPEWSVSQLDKKFQIAEVLNGDNQSTYYKLAISFNDVIKSESKYKVGVGYASDAKKLVMGMQLFEVEEIMGCCGYVDSAGDHYACYWALEDGRLVYVKFTMEEETEEKIVKSINFICGTISWLNEGTAWDDCVRTCADVIASKSLKEGLELNPEWIVEIRIQPGIVD